MGLFWTLIWTPFAENKVSRDVRKLLDFWIDFWSSLGPENGSTSMKNRSSGLSWAKMAPRRCPFEPTWLQEPILNDLLIDVLIILGWCPIDFGLIFVCSKNKFWINLGCCPIDFGMIFVHSKNHFLLFLDRLWIILGWCPIDFGLISFRFCHGLAWCSHDVEIDFRQTWTNLYWP